MSQRIAIATTELARQPLAQARPPGSGSASSDALGHIRRGYERGALPSPGARRAGRWRRRERRGHRRGAAARSRGCASASPTPWSRRISIAAMRPRSSRRRRSSRCCTFLRDDASARASTSSSTSPPSITSVSEPRFELVYHLYSLARGHRLRLKARVPEDDPRIASLTPVWRRRELARARDLRHVRHPLRRPSGSAAHLSLRGVPGSPAAQGLSEGEAPAARRSPAVGSPR